jgi:phosphoribosyl-ATP pyrophosphohydrolase/phosphoribosyl-AMP cyclohydrolase
MIAMEPDFKKSPDGLLPVIVQDYRTSKVLMLGYMNEKSYQYTLDDGRVTFYSRSKKRMWMKGETSDNFLYVQNILIDCDRDTILIKARPAGPVCHTGADTCFNEDNVTDSFLSTLEQIIHERKTNPTDSSYTSGLFKKGINKIAQKVGEEATEVIIEAIADDKELFKNEAADLLFHYLILLQAKGCYLKDVEDILKKRHKPNK